MKNKKNILVIGGNGFLGKWLIKNLSFDKFEVSILDQNISKKEFKNYNIKYYFNFSTSNNTKIKNALNKVRWDIIIHLAAYGGNGNGLLKAADENFKEGMQVNVVNFRNILEVLKHKQQIKFIWSSSTVVYGEQKYYKNGIVSEKSTLCPSTNYGLTKVLAEDIANYYNNKYAMNIIGIRYPIIVGPYLSYRGVAAGISDMARSCIELKKSKINMVSSALDLIYIKDAVSIIINIIDTNKKIGSIYNCPSFRTNAKELARYFNKYTKKNIISVKNIGKGTTYPIMNSELLERDLNFYINYRMTKTIKDWTKELQN